MSLFKFYYYITFEFFKPLINDFLNQMLNTMKVNVRGNQNFIQY